jgi:hypothetical protein
VKRAAVIITLALSSATASADDYVDHANVVLLGTELMPMPTVAAHADAEGALRLLRRHFVVEGRMGAGLAFSAADGGNVFGFRAGASAGYAIPLRKHPFVVAPMLAYDAFILKERKDDAEAIQRVTGQLTITWLVYPHAVVDLSGQLGLQWFRGVRDIAMVIVPRIGIVF